jgi:hypothetical protein
MDDRLTLRGRWVHARSIHRYLALSKPRPNNMRHSRCDPELTFSLSLSLSTDFSDGAVVSGRKPPCRCGLFRSPPVAQTRRQWSLLFRDSARLFDVNSFASLAHALANCPCSETSPRVTTHEVCSATSQPPIVFVLCKVG